MTENTVSEVGTEAVVPSPLTVFQHPKQESRNGEPTDIPDPDRFLRAAKEIAVENYNRHRDASKTRMLAVDQVFIVWFTKAMSNWKAIIASPVARGLLWEVSYNGHREQAYIDVYKKLNSSTTNVGAL